jgi:hypothetical protein
MAADVREEKREIREETTLEKQDPEYAELEEQFKEEGHKASQDEKDVENIIENFKENVDAIQPPSINGVSLGKAKELLQKFEEEKVRPDIYLMLSRLWYNCDLCSPETSRPPRTK